MFPIRDINPVYITPWAKYIFIGACVAVFFLLQAQQTLAEAEEFLFRRAAISCEILRDQPLALAEISGQTCMASPGAPLFPEKSPWLSVLTSLFLHGSLAHLGFNMWFLWIFGNNVEEAYGHFRFIFLYFVGGIAATMAFVLANPDSTIPLVGASGAIAAVLGAYAVLYPTHQVITLVGWILLPIPAFVFLGIWLLVQFGLGGTNIAWEAHVGGFVFGFLVTLLFRRSLVRRLG